MPLGGARWDPLYLAIAVALSSTVIIVKVLYEKRELDTLPGRITLGVLVLQDLFAILFLAVQPNLDNLQIGILLLSVGRVFVLVGAALLISRFVLPWIFHRIARSPELVLVGALAWCFLVGRSRRAAASVARDGRAGRGRRDLDLPLCARRHRQGDDPARFLHHAVLRRARHDHPAADRLHHRPGAGDRRASSSSAGSSRCSCRSISCGKDCARACCRPSTSRR